MAPDSELRSDSTPSAAEDTSRSRLRSWPPARRGAEPPAATARRPALRSLAAERAIVPGPRTARTAGSRESLRWARSRVASRDGVVTAPRRATATISKGSVQPAPIDAATVSYCARASLPAGSDCAAGEPVRRPSTGMQAASRSSVAPIASGGPLRGGAGERRR